MDDQPTWSWLNSVNSWRPAAAKHRRNAGFLFNVRSEAVRHQQTTMSEWRNLTWALTRPLQSFSSYVDAIIPASPPWWVLERVAQVSSHRRAVSQLWRSTKSDGWRAELGRRGSSASTHLHSKFLVSLKGSSNHGTCNDGIKCHFKNTDTFMFMWAHTAKKAPIIKVPHIPSLRSSWYKQFLIALKQKCKAGVQFCVYTFQSAHISPFLLPSHSVWCVSGKRSSKLCVGYQAWVKMLCTVILVEWLDSNAYIVWPKC